MIPVPSGVRVWLSVGRTDMRRGMNGLALQVQETLGRDPFVGDLFMFRGARGDLIKILWHDGLGISLYAKRLERGRFISYGLCQAPERGSTSAPDISGRRGRHSHLCNPQRSGRRDVLDGRSSSYSRVGYLMMTVRRRSASFWPRTSAYRLVQNEFEGSLYRARRPGLCGQQGIEIIRQFGSCARLPT
jgi:transposase